MRSIGGPIEIVRPEGYYVYMVLRFLVAGILVPAGTGLLVYGFLRWRHPGDKASVGLALLLPLLVTWAWGLLAVVFYAAIRDPYSDELHYFRLMTIIQLCLMVAAARTGYYDSRVAKPSTTPAELAAQQEE